MSGGPESGSSDDDTNDSDGDGDEEDWEALASLRFSVQDTRKEDVLFAFPAGERSPILPRDIADQTDMLQSNVSRELRKLRDMNLVRPLNPEKHNYKPYVITSKGLKIREMIEANNS